jgi:phospholipid-binding lipoprotein MlaA
LAVTLFKLPACVVDPETRGRRARNRRSGLIAAMAMASIAVADASHAAATTAPNDPFERINRRGFAIQQALTRKGLGIFGVIYRALTPGPIGKAIHNILVNLSEPVVVFNDVLQLRPARAGAAAARFVVNSTVGVAGMIDVTGKTGLPHRPSSFGDTLGRYGVGPGPYLFIPVIGPSTVRDLFGNVVDAVVDPLHFAVYPYRQQVSLTVGVVGGLDQLVSSEPDLRALLSNAADPYATLRSTYLQNRQAEVTGETSVPVVLPDLDETAPAAPPQPPSPSANLTVGLPGLAARGAPDQSAAFQSLPDGQDGQSHGQFTGAFDQRQGDGHLGSKPEQRPQDGVAGFLDSNPHGGHESGAANGHDQSLQTQDREGTDSDAGHS